jgi:hypothetical protein
MDGYDRMFRDLQDYHREVSYRDAMVTKIIRHFLPRLCWLSEA